MEKQQSTGNYNAIIACILMALAVILGAFGAHALEGNITPRYLEVYETANFYHYIHALGILLLSQIKNTYWARFFLLLGLMLFSGSLYLLATSSLLGIENLKPILGPITPIGGVLFIIGWTLAAFSLRPSNKS